MQTAATNHDFDTTRRAEFDGFFAKLGQGVNAYLERLARADQVRRLDAMSDEQLAELGIGRNEIVRYVFRDRFYA